MSTSKLVTAFKHLLLASALVLNGCAATRAPSRGDVDAEADAPPEGEDDGVKGINQQLKQFNAALAKKDFEEAAKRLRKAQLGVQRASDITKSHPEFEDVAETVESSKTRYETAMERDRIERRNMAIDDLVKRGLVLMGRADTIEAQVKDTVPSPDDVTGMRNLLQEFAAVRAEGMQYRDDQPYMVHAGERDKRNRAFLQRELSAQWQIDASASLAPQIETAKQAIVQAQKAATADEQATAYGAAAQALTTCSSTIASLEHKEYDIDPRLVQTPLGIMTIRELRKECGERSTKLRGEVDKISWHGRVNAAIANTITAAQTRSKAKSGAEVAAAIDAEITALASCATELDAATKMPGFDAKTTFESPYGNVTTSAIAKQCGTDRTQLQKDRPVFVWRGTADTMKDQLANSKETAAKAKSVEKNAEKIEQWSAAKNAANTCSDQATKLEAAKEADKRYPIKTSSGAMTIVKLHEDCDALGKNADAELKTARSALELEQFLTTLVNDEIEVAKREGVPQRIDQVEGGRVFVYEKISYGFDTQGKRYDFRAAWKAKVEGVASEVTNAVAPVKAAANAEAQLAATEAAIPVLTKCESALPSIEKKPGFDAEAQFDTPMGKLYAVQIQKSCAQQREKLQPTVVPLKWKAQLEKVRDRASEADVRAKSAKSLATAGERVTALSTAMGGFRECNERAESMATGAGADAKAEVESPFGKVTRKKLSSECSAALGRTQKELDVAIADKKLEDFVTAAQGDEKEVAKREGMPTRVESKGSGRVFVYEVKATKGKKAETKRFPFNQAGQRVAEDALQ